MGESRWTEGRMSVVYVLVDMKSWTGIVNTRSFVRELDALAIAGAYFVDVGISEVLRIQNYRSSNHRTTTKPIWFGEIVVVLLARQRHEKRRNFVEQTGQSDYQAEVNGGALGVAGINEHEGNVQLLNAFTSHFSRSSW